MTPRNAQIPLNMASLDEIKPAAALIQSAKALIELSEAQLAALQLADAFASHPRLLGLSIRPGPRYSNSPPAPGGSRPFCQTDTNLSDEISQARRALDQLAEGEPEALELEAELDEIVAAQLAADAWLNGLSAARSQRLIGRSFERPATEAELISAAMALVLAPAEFSAWQAESLEQAAASPSPAKAPKAL